MKERWSYVVARVVPGLSKHTGAFVLEGTAVLYCLTPEDKDSTNHRNVSPRCVTYWRSESSAVPLWGPQMSQCSCCNTWRFEVSKYNKMLKPTWEERRSVSACVGFRNPTLWNWHLRLLTVVGRRLLYAPRGLILQISTFCPHSVFMCFVWIWKQTVIISLYSFNWLVFITETECVYCAVRTGSLYMMQVKVCP